MKYLFFYLIILLFTLIGCNKDDSTTNPNDNSNYNPLPLKVGNYWIYNHSTPIANGVDTNMISSTIMINNENIYMLNDDWLFDHEGAYYKDNQLIGAKVRSDSTIRATTVVFPSNPSVNQSWIVEGSTWELLSKNYQVIVPAGTFNCYQIIDKSNNPLSNWIGYIYWANNIGLVKYEGSDGTDSEILELKSYKVN